MDSERGTVISYSDYDSNSKWYNSNDKEDNDIVGCVIRKDNDNDIVGFVIGTDNDNNVM